MNKTELISAVAAATELSRKDADKAVNAAVLCLLGLGISAYLLLAPRPTQSGIENRELAKAGEKVQIVGLGGFEVKERAARAARNPRTGEEIQIAASKSVSFKPGKALKDEING